MTLYEVTYRLPGGILAIEVTTSREVARSIVKEAMLKGGLDIAVNRPEA